MQPDTSGGPLPGPFSKVLPGPFFQSVPLHTAFAPMWNYFRVICFYAILCYSGLPFFLHCPALRLPLGTVLECSASCRTSLRHCPVLRLPLCTVSECQESKHHLALEGNLWFVFEWEEMCLHSGEPSKPMSVWCNNCLPSLRTTEDSAISIGLIHVDVNSNTGET